MDKTEEYLFYYWIKGVPEDRDGGPWWHKRSDCKLTLIHFSRSFRNLLHAKTFVSVADHECDKECHSKSPPEELTILYP